MWKECEATVSFFYTNRMLKEEEIAISGLTEDKPKALRLVNVGSTKEVDSIERGKYLQRLLHFLQPAEFPGVAADENISKGSFVLEYKYDKSYPKSEKEEHLKEYESNGEGNYILEAQLPNNKWICLDATRNHDSWARYINHGPGKHANLKMFRPLQIQGKWRVAFLAIRDIEEGDQLLFDYGKQTHPPNWMRGRKQPQIHIVQDPKEQPANSTNSPHQDSAACVAQNQPGTTTVTVTAIVHSDESPQSAPACSQCTEPTIKGLCKICGIICSSCFEQHNRMSAFSKHLRISTEDIKEFKGASKCGLCMAACDDQVYCKDCRAYMCAECRRQHSKMKFFSGHNVQHSDLCPECGQQRLAITDTFVCTSCIFKSDPNPVSR